MHTYFSGCKKYTDNICLKKLIMTNKELKGKSKCADCMTNKSFFDKKKHKSELEIIVNYKTKHDNVLCKV